MKVSLKSADKVVEIGDFQKFSNYFHKINFGALWRRI